MATANELPQTQQAALERLTKGPVDWSSTTSVEARALNALVKKGLAKKVTDRFTRYVLA